jgi:hypothetical protein
LCTLDPFAGSGEGSFVEWLEAEHTLLSSALTDWGQVVDGITALPRAG